MTESAAQEILRVGRSPSLRGVCSVPGDNPSPTVRCFSGRFVEAPSRSADSGWAATMPPPPRPCVR
jgi:hypothetical protein